VVEGTNADTSYAHRILDDVGHLRTRARRERRQHALWVALIGAVALLGAVGFAVTDQIETRSCQDIGGGGLACTVATRGFDFGWLWLLGAAAVVAVPYVRRYRRGTWRPSSGVWIAMAIVVFLILPVVVPLSSAVPAYVYPVLAAAAVAAVAVQRRDAAATVAAVLLAGAMLYVELGVDSARLLERNLGLALSALSVALLAFGLAVWWDRRVVGNRA
jgi:hypothetical protein